MVHWTTWAVGVSAARVPTLGTSAGSLPGSEWLPPERPIVSAPGPRLPVADLVFLGPIKRHADELTDSELIGAPEEEEGARALP